MSEYMYVILHPHTICNKYGEPIIPNLCELYSIKERLNYDEKYKEYYVYDYEKRKVIFKYAYYKDKKIYIDKENFYKNKVYKTFYTKEEKINHYVYDLCKHQECYENNNCTYVHKLQLKRKREDDIEYYKTENEKIKKKLIILENDKLNLQSDNDILRTCINEYKIKMIRINSFFDSK